MTKPTATAGPADVSALKNGGVFVLHESAPVPAQRTLIVLGLARSGTTMVAGCLHHLGVPMVEKPNPVFEDVPIAQAMESSDLPALKALIDKRNATHAVWGFKRPSALGTIREIERHFRNPEYVVIFRDLFAIANRNRISVLSDLATNMRNSLKQYETLVDFVARCKSRALLVSYEKAMENPDRFVAALAAFAGVGAPALITKARAFVQHEPPEYLKSSRLVRGVGRLGKTSHRVIAGWAYVDGQEKPATVQVRVNGHELATTVADRKRPDIQTKGTHPTGDCGFRVELPPRKRLQDGDLVSVRVVGDIQDLAGSPRKVGDKAE